MRVSQLKMPSFYLILFLFVLTLPFLVGCSDNWTTFFSSSLSVERTAQGTPTPLSTFALSSSAISPTNTLQAIVPRVATETPLPSPTMTQSPTPSPSTTPTATFSPTVTPSPTAEPSVTPSPTPEPSATPSPTPSVTASPTIIPSPTMTMTPHADAEVEIEVQPGETIEEIAQAFGLPVEELALYNGFEQTERVALHGIKIRVPLGEARIAAMYATATAIAVTPTPVRPSFVVLDMNHNFQGRNNCAPAATSMVLNTLGVQKTQFDMASLQKPMASDVNVTAEEVAVSIREIGLGAYVGINGNVELIERLLAAGFPVMTEEWMPYDGGMGHFRAIRGYDQSDYTILYNDSYYGNELWRSYKNFLEAWAPFNNKFVVPYHWHQEEQLKAIIGSNWDESAMYEQFRLNMESQLANNPNDPYLLWGLGEALVKLGSPFEAVQLFEKAIATNALPWRYMWYRYGYFEALNQVGRHEDLLSVTLPTLNQMGMSEDLRYHRAIAFNALGRPEDARAELQQALWENPRFVPASHLLSQMGY